jgi:hypothetical protein
MSHEENSVYIKAKVHCIGNTHDGGWCSDPYDTREIDTTTDEEIEVPNKQFIKDFCDSEGCVDYDGLQKLSYEYTLCSGSGYCGKKVVKRVTSGVLKMRRDNFKSKCLETMSSDEDDTPAPHTSYTTHHPPMPKSHAPMPIVNTFRGRINSTYTSNPSWYSNSAPTGSAGHTIASKKSKFDNPEYRRKVGKIPCNRGTNCSRKNHTTKPCYYKHD